MQVEAEVFIRSTCTLAGSPVWEEATNSLLWVDVPGRKLWRAHSQATSASQFSFDHMPTSVVLHASKGLLVIFENLIVAYDPKSNSQKAVARIEPDKPQNRLNDGKCDPYGRLWIGSMNREGSEPTGALYCVERDFRIRKILEGVTMSGGLAWDLKRHAMYYVDSVTREIARFKFNPEDGRISKGKAVIRMPDENAAFYGLTIDRRGNLWVAHYGAGKVVCWDPENATRLKEVSVPAPKVSSCTFGGPDLDELFITTARERMTENELALYPLSGSIFRARVSARGRVPDMFDGERA